MKLEERLNNIKSNIRSKQNAIKQDTVESLKNIDNKLGVVERLTNISNDIKKHIETTQRNDFKAVLNKLDELIINIESNKSVKINNLSLEKTEALLSELIQKNAIKFPTEPKDAIPVVLTDKQRKEFYNALSSIALGSGGSNGKIIGSSGNIADVTVDGKLKVDASVVATVDTTGLATEDKQDDIITAIENITVPAPVGGATSDNQTNGSQKTQIVDAGGEAVTVTGGKLDVNASIDTTGLATSAKQDTLIGHVDGVETLLGTIDTDTSNLSTKIDTIAGAVSGTEMQVDVLTMPTVTVDLGANNDVVVSGTLTGITNVVHVDDNSGSLTVDGTVTANLSATDNAVLDNIDTDLTTLIDAVDGVEALLTTIDADTSKIPSQGQALASASMPVVLPADQITTLTPPAAITGYALDATLTDNSQTTQIVDALGDAVEVTSGGLHVNIADVGGLALDNTLIDASQKTQIVDGAGNVIGATSNALDVNIKSGASSGTQYTEGDTDATITGTAMMFETNTGTNALGVVNASNPLPVSVTGGGDATAANQTTIIGHVDGIETLIGTTNSTLSTIDADTSNISTKIDTIAGDTTNIETAVQLIDDTVYTDGSGTPSKGIAVMGTDGTNPQIIKTDTNGELQVDVLSMPTTTVQATDLDIRNLTNTDVVTAELSAVDNAVLDTIAAKDFATQTTLAAMNAKFVTGTDIGDVTINNASGASAVNIQDGGNTITVDGTVAVTSAGITTIAGAVSGTEMQVDIVASIPAGTNNIGDVDIASIAAGDNNIGNVDIVTMPNVTIGSALPAGTNAIGKLSANSGVDIGDVDVTSLPALASGTNAIGKLLPADIDVTAHTNYKKFYYTNAGAVTDGIVWSPAAGKRWHILWMLINVSADATVTFEDDKAGGDEVVMKAEIAAKSGFPVTCPEKYPLASGEDAADLIVTTTAGNVYIFGVGYEV